MLCARYSPRQHAGQACEPRVTDYDRSDLPAAYDRGRDHGPAQLEIWVRAVAGHLARAPAQILDLGCGTGRFSDTLSAYFRADVIGLDPSGKMLRQAAAKPHGSGVRYARGCAEAMPLRSGSIDLIYMSMSLHHFSNPERAARECRRVLHADGCVFIRTGTREQIPAYPYYPFFPASHPILVEVLPSSCRVCELYEAVGFRLIAQDVITQTIAPDWAAYADKLTTRSDSVLARLSDEDLERGIAAIRRHGIGRPPEAVVEPIDLFVFRCA
jgi:ubiquinone/menaquinone biosynthesis C-methylase UbiE